MGRFVERPNRFSVVIEPCTAKSGEQPGRIKAHCPNPGRLQELLTPGAEVLLEKSPRAERKTAWTLAAVLFQGKVVPLISVRANRIARSLVLPALFPEAVSLRPEYSIGHSRFDFQTELPDNRQALIEVKSCTLSAEGRAMFPDAPTERGLRHIQYLAEIAESDPETEGHVIFMLHHPDTLRFTPNFHTDQEFSLALWRLSRRLHLHAVSLDCDFNGMCRIVQPDIPFDFAPVRFAEEDRGAYMLLLFLKEAAVIKVGALGEMTFAPGYYLYAGSARAHLKSRVSRHLRKKRKRFHWHIDYLRAYAAEAKALPIFTGQDIECEMAASLQSIGGRPVKNFGASDCSCTSHLFQFSENPLNSPSFHRQLLRFRHARI